MLDSIFQNSMLHPTSGDDEMEMIPPAPSVQPTPAVVVLGRFQPLHRGHCHLIHHAAAYRDQHQPEMTLRVMVGSSNREPSPFNPWTWEERIEMIISWLESENILNHEVLAVPDLGDEERWVEHAEHWHGRSGVLVTSNESTRELYARAGWNVEMFGLENRDSLEGWRIRETLKMLVNSSKEEITAIMSSSVDAPVLKWLLADDERVRRLMFLGPSVEHVG